MKILVIDDHPVELRLLGDVFAASGYVVARAPCAEDALAKIARTRPDIVIVDLNMPGIDGLALTHAIKANPETQDIPVVCVTAAPEQFTRERAIEVGCDAYLTKPLNMTKLPEDVHAIARREAGN